MELSGLKQWLQERYASRDCGDEGVEEKKSAWCVNAAILRDSERVRGLKKGCSGKRFYGLRHGCMIEMYVV